VLSYGPDDINAILKNRRGHCGHQFAVFSQLAAAAGIGV